MIASAQGLTLDVIVPIYNEADVLGYLLDALDTTFSAANLSPRNIASAHYVFVSGSCVGASRQMVLLEPGSFRPTHCYTVC
jgi:hypothetical protein